MNCKDFILEVKSSNNCPDDFDHVYSEFQTYQELALGTLAAFHKVCEENGIIYQLGFGSLLGAIRDDGQIPWDYDIDVIIPYSERHKLVDAMKRDLPEEYYYYCPESNPKCRHYFMRVSPKGYRSDRLHVDVFYVIGAPNDEVERNSFEAEMNKYFYLRYAKLVRINEFPINSYKGKALALIQKAKLCTTSITSVNSKLKEICERYDPSISGITIPVFDAYKHIYWNTSELWDTTLITTSVGTFRITKNYDTILHSIYKDYKKIYPLQSRLDELYKSFFLLKYNKVLRKRNSSIRYYINHE